MLNFKKAAKTLLMAGAVATGAGCDRVPQTTPDGTGHILITSFTPDAKILRAVTDEVEPALNGHHVKFKDACRGGTEYSLPSQSTIIAQRPAQPATPQNGDLATPAATYRCPEFF